MSKRAKKQASKRGVPERVRRLSNLVCECEKLMTRLVAQREKRRKEFMAILDRVTSAQVEQSQKKLKVLSYGLSGTGKSTFAGSAGLMDSQGRVGEERGPGKLLYAWTEANGVLSVQRLGTDCDLLPIKSWTDLQDLLRAFKGVAPDQDGLVHGYHTVALDSLTEMQRLIIDIYKTLNKGKKDEGITLPQWGEIIDRTIQMVRAFRDLPLHVIVTALAAETMVDKNAEEKQRLVRPELKGRSLPSELAQFFHVVGYHFRRLHQGQADYRILLEGRDDFLTKPCPGLAYQEVPDFPYMVRTVVGGGAPRDVKARMAATPMLSVPVVYEQTENEEKEGDQ